MKNKALIVGVTGIVGSNFAAELLVQGWTVYGLARNPENALQGVISIAVNLLDSTALRIALTEVAPTHVFFTTWMRQETEQENCVVNAALVKNLLEVLAVKQCIKHVALVTGLKHYLGPFEAYVASGVLPETPLREEQYRLPLENFYYAQEDELFAMATRYGFTWSVHRPHTIIGYALGNLMNMGVTLAVYASICKEQGLPMLWPGSAAQWLGVSDVTDAHILAKHILWATTEDQAANEAFNIVNGNVFRWQWLWKEIALYFEIPFQGYTTGNATLTSFLKGKNEVWQAMVEKYSLQQINLDHLASPWHTDADLGRPVEVITDMSKSRALGFNAFQTTKSSFIALFDRLRRERVIP